ncbi:MAG: response regulator [Pirellulaceae bacterium]
MPKILVVDDSKLDRVFAASLLENTEYEVAFAENGVKAMEIIERQTPDLMLTDLKMPEMDGLELVNNARLRVPHLPIVLMTAHGSEAIAAQALQQGAASYVPKSELAQKLVPTLDELTALQRADRSYSRLVECSTLTEFEFVLPNDPSTIDPLVDLTQQMMQSMGLCDGNGEIQIGVALEQALQNAMIHGNLELSGEQLRDMDEPDRLIRARRASEPYKSRTVRVQLRISRDEAVFEVSDQGLGFNPSQFGNDLEESSQSNGRGLVLMQAFMDEVEFKDSGRCVRMVKRRSK